MWSLVISQYSSVVQKFIVVTLLSLGYLVTELGLQYADFRYVAIAVTAFVSAFVFKLWEYLWIPVFIQRLFCPNLTGDWKGELEAKYKLPEHDEVQVKFVNVDFKIKMTFSSFEMIGVSEDDYMRSEVVSSKLKKEGGRLFLYYTYQVHVKNPMPSDEQFFMGSARLELIWNNDNFNFEGNYWTNRKWNVGGQTAGHIKLVKLPV